MLALHLAVQGSLVVSPMYLDETPPPLRSARQILLLHDRVAGSPERRSLEETLSLARDLVTRLRAGLDFEQQAGRISQAEDASRGGVLGSFAPGMLAGELDRFLFTAGIGDVSDPIDSAAGVRILQRIDTWAAVRHILVRGEDDASRARCERLLKRLGEGEDFAKLAREHSEDEQTAGVGGDLAVYERGPADSMLKAAAFRMEVGAVAGPLRSPLGWHVLQRVPPESFAAAVRENNFVRLRGILVRFDGAGGTGPAALRNAHEARALIDGLRRRLAEGEDMVDLAREHDEDPGGRERRGDLGWIHRRQPGLPQVLRVACLLNVGDTTGPAVTSAGYLILRRER